MLLGAAGRREINVRIVIANFSPPLRQSMDFRSAWATHAWPQRGERQTLFEQPVGWGFHIFALGVYLLDRGVAHEVEFWDYRERRSTSYLSNGVLRVHFWNEADVQAYLAERGYPDLFINYGREGKPILRLLEGKSFRVDVPCLRAGLNRLSNHDAECYLVDDERYLDARSMLYIPVVNLRKIAPVQRPFERDFIYLASDYAGKRHDLLLRSVRGTTLTGHFHPVDATRLDLSGTRVTTSTWDERDLVDLLTTSRIAVYPADQTSNPAALWECVAAGLPIVVNRAIEGGRHVVVPGVTGELAPERKFRSVMEAVLAKREMYRPRQYFETHWDTVTLLESYLRFFARMGWTSI